MKKRAFVKGGLVMAGKPVRFFSVRLLAGMLACFPFSCARYAQAPTGGPADLAPPMLVEALPAQGSTDFASTQIRLAFDEYVVLQKTENIVTSPPLSRISYTTNLKEVLVVIEDTLKPDRTYSINFKDAIGDLHESTPLQNYTYVFSTGETVDSGRISGVAIDAQTLKPVKSVSVMFYARKPEGFPVTSEPDYVAVADTGGFFEVSYMKEGCYYVLAAEEEARDYRISPTEERSAFSSSCWETQDFREPVLFQKRQGKKESDTGMRVAYDQALSAYRSESLRQAKELGHELFFYQDFQPEVFLKEAKWTTKGKIELDWYYAPDPDSLEFVFLPSFADVELSARILQEQQARQEEDTLGPKQGRRARREADFSEMEMPDLTWPSRLRFQVAGEEDPLKAKIYFDDYAVDDLRLVVRNGRFSDTAELSLSHSVAASSDTAAFRVSARKTTLLHTDSLVLDFTLPMLESDLEKASLYQYCSDEEGRKDTLLIDAGNLRLQRIGPLRVSLSYDWQAGCSYLLYLPSACFCDYFGRLIDTTRVRFSIPDLLSYGQVAVTLSGLDSNAVYVLQVLPAGGKAPLFEKVVEREGMYEFPYVSPATVSLVLFEDRNRNGKWDGGHYPSGLQPERRWIFPKNLPVEADWRIEEKWELPPRQ